MAINLTEIQKRIASIVDQSPDAPTEGGDDWNLRLQYINLAQNRAFQLYDWQFLNKEYNTQTSTNTGNTSISLPGDYRKLASYPYISYDGTNTNEFAEIRVQERSKKLTSDKFVYFLGNESDGQTMVINSGNSNGQLPSGASIRIPYYSAGSSLISGCDVSMIPNADYLVTSGVATLWEAREDERFPQAKAEAERILQRLLERENVFSEANNDASQVRTVEETKYNFRLGRN